MVLVPGGDARVAVVGAAELDDVDGVVLRMSSAGVRWWLHGRATLVWGDVGTTGFHTEAESEGGNRYGIRRRSPGGSISDEDLVGDVIEATTPTEITLVKRTERLFGADRLLAIVVEPPSGASLKEPRRRRTVVVLGDSWAAGFGVRGDIPVPVVDDQGRPTKVLKAPGPRCPFTPETQDVRQAWPQVLADALGNGVGDVDVAVVAWSGRGMAQDWQGDPDPETVPELLAASVVAPEVVAGVVVALGHNDAESGLLDAMAFRAAWQAHLNELQRRFGEETPIVVVVPTFNDPPPALDRHDLVGSLFASIDLPRTVHLVDEPALNDALGLGCVWHPGTRSQADLARRMLPDVAAALGLPMVR